ncbi:MAG: hypothetical protein LKJ86_03750 [Oscillibacter sp.]|nr:hypothetical protein [Oscillibacter sp.]
MGKTLKRIFATVLALSISIGLLSVNAFAGAVEDTAVADAQQAVSAAEGELAAAQQSLDAAMAAAAEGIDLAGAKQAQQDATNAQIAAQNTLNMLTNEINYYQEMLGMLSGMAGGEENMQAIAALQEQISALYEPIATAQNELAVAQQAAQIAQDALANVQSQYDAACDASPDVVSAREIVAACETARNDAQSALAAAQAVQADANAEEPVAAQIRALDTDIGVGSITAVYAANRAFMALTPDRQSDFQNNRFPDEYQTLQNALTKLASLITVTNSLDEFNDAMKDNTVSCIELRGSHTNTFLISRDCTVILNGVTITGAPAPVQTRDASVSCAAVAVAPGVKATIILEGENTLTGGDGYAGLEVGFADENSMADVTIDGNGSLTANGGSGKGGAGIGGSYASSPVYGNLTIAGGTITANGTNGGAGIGSAANNLGSGASYKIAAKSWGTITVNGGTITAIGNGGGAGIGGGNHIDSGELVFQGGTVVRAEGNGGGAGIGSGCGSQKVENDGTKGPGYFFADIHIGGDAVIEEAVSTWLGAGIGGGYVSDAYVSITGGTIEAAQGGNGNSGSLYQGGTGIGGGYQGCAQVNISGGTIETAQGGTGAPGIGNGAACRADKRNGESTIVADDSYVNISGGTIQAQGGVYAAGIGTGNGGEVCHVSISGGSVIAKGASSDRTEMMGGAGIGSGVGSASGLKYAADTTVDISITGGTVTATGGWGASGIGSGAINTQANSITIGDGANVTALADGTKFAIDTKVGGDDTISYTPECTVSETVLQGTFVNLAEHTYEGKALTIRTFANTPVDVAALQLPEGYRSFARTVPAAGLYLVYSNANERYCVYNTQNPMEFEENEENGAPTFEYKVEGTGLSDKFYLYLNDQTPVLPDPPAPIPNPPAPIPNEPDETPADTEIPGTVTPLTPAPEKVIPDQETPLTELPDEEVPLAAAPKTGDTLTAVLSAACAAASLAGLAYLVITEKKRAKSEN